MRRGPMGELTLRAMASKYVYDFSEGGELGRELLGGKGVGLAEMTVIGLPVPAGFTVTTEACREYMERGGEPPGRSGRAVDLTDVGDLHRQRVYEAGPSG